MTLGLDISDALPFLRQQAESIMRSTVIVRRSTGNVWDEESGTYVPGVVTIYEGVARLRMPSVQAREVDVAGQRVVETSPTLSLPIGSPEGAQVRLDDVVELVAHTPDPLLVGTVMRVVDAVDQTYSTARRFTVEIITPKA